MTDRQLWWWGGGAVVALAAWLIWRDDLAARAARGGRPARHIGASAVLGRPLDTTYGQVTPENPTRLDWSGHRVRYPLAPGRELERLMYGAPGVCAVAVPRAQRGWLFCPPAEEDY